MEQRIEELGSGYVWGLLEPDEHAEFEHLLKTDERARKLFAALCEDEMLLWGNLRPARDGEVPREPVASPPRPKPLRERLGFAAALALAFGLGWAASRRGLGEPLGEGLSRSTAVVTGSDESGAGQPIPIVLPAPDLWLVPLDFDERGQLSQRMTQDTEPLEIANL